MTPRSSMLIETARAASQALLAYREDLLDGATCTLDTAEVIAVSDALLILEDMTRSARLGCVARARLVAPAARAPGECFVCGAKYREPCTDIAGAPLRVNHPTRCDT